MIVLSTRACPAPCRPAPRAATSGDPCQHARCGPAVEPLDRVPVAELGRQPAPGATLEHQPRVEHLTRNLEMVARRRQQRSNPRVLRVGHFWFVTAHQDRAANPPHSATTDRCEQALGTTSTDRWATFRPQQRSPRATRAMIESGAVGVRSLWRRAHRLAQLTLLSRPWPTGTVHPLGLERQADRAVQDSHAADRLIESPLGSAGLLATEPTRGVLCLRPIAD